MGEGQSASDVAGPGADTTAATATPQGWVAPALWRGTRSEEREYADDYSKRCSRVHNDNGCGVFLVRNFCGRGVGGR
jgi:hypothetical protein